MALWLSFFKLDISVVTDDHLRRIISMFKTFGTAQTKGPICNKDQWHSYRYNSVPQVLILTLTCLLTSNAANCSLATPGMRLPVCLWVITYWSTGGVKLTLPCLLGTVLSGYDLHPFHQTDFNLFKNRNSELIINLTIYFPIMLIVVKLNVAIKSLQLILSINFSEDIANMYVYSCFRTGTKNDACL